MRGQGRAVQTEGTAWVRWVTFVLVTSLMVVQLGCRGDHGKIQDRIPFLGQPLSERLKLLPLEPDTLSQRYGAIVFLNREAARHAGALVADVDSLLRRGCYVCLVVGRRAWLGQVPQGAVVVDDPGGKLASEFGFRASENGFIIFRRRGALCCAAVKTRGLETLRTRLVARAAQLVVGRQAAADTTRSEEVDLRQVEQIRSFPWDSVLSAAQEVELDLDTIHRRSLTVVREVAAGDMPEPSDVVFSRPVDLAVDGLGRLFVCDDRRGRVFVLDELGGQIGFLGGYGEGPGEMTHPSRIALCGAKILVAEYCCRVHEFGPELNWIRTETWPVQINPFTGFCAFRGVLLVTQPPLPPDRTDVFQVYVWSREGLFPISSFLPYAEPRRKYKDTFGALASRNIVTLATDGIRYIAFYRAAEKNFAVVDFQSRKAWRYSLKGKDVRLTPKREVAAPPFAVVRLIRDMDFGDSEKLYALVQYYGLLELDVSRRTGVALYQRDDLPDEDATLRLYSAVSVRLPRVYLASPMLAQVSVCRLGG